jgi:hypothetical protein
MRAPWSWPASDGARRSSPDPIPAHIGEASFKRKRPSRAGNGPVPKFTLP